jgi:hypothetical protein
MALTETGVTHPKAMRSDGRRNRCHRQLGGTAALVPL